MEDTLVTSEKSDKRIKCTEVIGMPVLSISEGEKIGTVKKVLIEHGEIQQVVFLVRVNETYEGSKILKASNVRKIGKDAIVIDAAENLLSIEEAGKESKFYETNTCCGKKVTDSSGEEIGQSICCMLERQEVCLSGILVTNSDGSTREIPGKDLIEVQDDKIVVNIAGSKTDDEQVLQMEKDVVIDADTIAKNIVENAASDLAEDKDEGQQDGLNQTDTVGQKVTVNQTDTVDQTDTAEKSFGSKGLKEILEERQDQFLLDKKVDRDIFTDDGAAIIKKDEVITLDVLKQAKECHKYLVLSFCIKRS